MMQKMLKNVKMSKNVKECLNIKKILKNVKKCQEMFKCQTCHVLFEWQLKCARFNNVYQKHFNR